jgi:hypothetical protein
MIMLLLNCNVCCISEATSYILDSHTTRISVVSLLHSVAKYRKFPMCYLHSLCILLSRSILSTGRHPHKKNQNPLVRSHIFAGDFKTTTAILYPTQDEYAAVVLMFTDCDRSPLSCVLY